MIDTPRQFFNELDVTIKYEKKFVLGKPGFDPRPSGNKPGIISFRPHQICTNHS